jgi:type IV secretion system protein VirB3
MTKDAAADEDIVLTPLVIGLTRPPMLWGVPYMAIVIVIAITIIAWLVSNRLASLSLAPALYLLLFSLSTSDSKFLEILQVACQQTPRTPTKSFWGTTSYAL